MRNRALAGLLTIVVLAGVGLFLGLRDWAKDLKLPKLPPTRECVVQAEGRVVLNAKQMANAATIAAVGVRREMPERAVVVALATALQESKLENLAGGDRDSVGLFQQRPSQGWGTAAQIRDPRYAARKFYASLKRVRGWERMRVTDAAQRVQRSAYPEAYEKWADESTVLARALLGNATGAVACTVSGNPARRGDAAAAALTEDLRLDWGALRTAPAAALGLTVPVDDARSGWRYAHWLVSHAAAHGVRSVRYGGLEWTADGGRWARPPGPTAPSTRSGATQVVAEVFADA